MPELTRSTVEEWIKTTTGEFHFKTVLGGNIAKSSEGKLRKIFHDICHAEKPVCEPVGRNDGRYRLIQERPEPLDWQGLDGNKDFPVILPFNLRRYVFIDPETCIIVAGSKDSGKSGIILRTVALNMHKMNVVLLTNIEGGAGQIKRRFDAMDIDIPVPAPFKIYSVSDNFHDYMGELDTLYLIDYIDVPDSGEFYMIAPAINKIQRKLMDKNSVAMIGLQKKRNVDLAFGGDQTVKKASLYLAVDKIGNTGKLKIVFAKRATNPKIFPVNMEFTFQYGGEGTNFINIQGGDGYEEPEKRSETMPF